MVSYAALLIQVVQGPPLLFVKSVQHQKQKSQQLRYVPGCVGGRTTGTHRSIIRPFWHDNAVLCVLCCAVVVHAVVCGVMTKAAGVLWC